MSFESFDQLKSMPTLFKWRSQLRIRRFYATLLRIESEFMKETDPARRADLRKNFEQISQTIGRMRVRPIVADQFYALRVHIDYVQRFMNQQSQQG